MKAKKRKKLRIVLIVVVAVLIVLFGGFYIYTLDYYRADSTAAAALAATDIRIEHKGEDIIFYPIQQIAVTKALAFYPGGKVEYTAYAPLMKGLARQGLACVLLKMPFNLAVFDTGAAERAYKLLPEIKEWYVGGHSLGGAMASSYVGTHADKLKGLILLGAYPVNASTVPTLAIYGSEDVKLDTSKLTGGIKTIKLDGGNHAQFGNYGVQAGDERRRSHARISRLRQSGRLWILSAALTNKRDAARCGTKEHKRF